MVPAFPPPGGYGMVVMVWKGRRVMVICTTTVNTFIIVGNYGTPR